MKPYLIEMLAGLFLASVIMAANIASRMEPTFVYQGF